MAKRKKKRKTLAVCRLTKKGKVFGCKRIRRRRKGGRRRKR